MDINMNKENSKEEKLAAALEYDKGKGIPQVIAKGKGSVAEQIIKRAKEENITLYEDKELVSLLNNLEIGESVPEVMYDVIAQVLVFVSEVDKKVKDKIRS